MKKLSLFGLVAILGAFVFVASCKKIKEAPAITITGDNPFTIGLGETYSDPGATAENSDGTTAEVTADLSLVNTSETGSFTVTYSATNEVGTQTATRTVNVVMSQSNWLGDWGVVDDCGTAASLQDVQTITAGATSSDLLIDNVVDLVGGQLTATISGNNITVPQQIIDLTVGNLTISGTGTVNATGDVITLNYTYDNDTPIIGGSGSCVATYTKQ